MQSILKGDVVMAEKKKKPTVFLALRVEPRDFILSSFTANLSHVAPPMDYHQDLVVPVNDEFVSEDMDVRVRLKGIDKPIRAFLMGWSSAFEDDPKTEELDERWQFIKGTNFANGGIVELSGTFNPFRKK